MPRPTKHAPERGEARIRLLDAARDLFRQKGYAGTSVEDICRAAEVTKGAFFHNFPGKQALGVAVAHYWHETTSAFFAGAPYHRSTDPLDRVLSYIAFRQSMIEGEASQYSCLAGTLVQEVHQSAPDIRQACAHAIFAHAATLEADIEAARQERGIDAGWSAAGLARHIHAVLQGGLVMAKAGQDPELARETLDHLARYIRQLFRLPMEDHA